MMPPAMIVTATVVFVALCIASDIRTRRIPNRLTAPAVVLGVALNAWCFGWNGVRMSLEGFGLGIALLFGPFALGGIGAGDVKMMGAVGALVGPAMVLQSLFVGFVLGGVLAVARLARIARLREKLAATGRMILNAMLSRSLEPLKAPSADPNAVTLPYSLPLGIGTASVIAISMVGKP